MKRAGFQAQAGRVSFTAGLEVGGIAEVSLYLSFDGRFLICGFLYRV